MALGTHRSYVVGDGPDGGHYVIMTKDQSVGRFIYSWGSYERNQLQRAVERAGVVPGLVMLDIGANLATASISGLLAGWFDRAIAVEADPDNARLIRANIALNGLEQKMTCLAVAAGSGEGVVRFAVDERRRGNSRVSEDGGIEVPVRSVVDIAAEAGLTPEQIGLIWVDVEGFEEQVVRGAGEFFEKVPWVLELRSALCDLSGLASCLVGRRVLVLSEHEMAVDRELSEGEIAAIVRGELDNVALDILVMPKDS